MKYQDFFKKTALHIAVENENAKIVQLLLSCPDIDVNITAIIIQYFLNDI